VAGPADLGGGPHRAARGGSSGSLQASRGGRWMPSPLARQGRPPTTASRGAAPSPVTAPPRLDGRAGMERQDWGASRLLA